MALNKEITNELNRMKKNIKDVVNNSIKSNINSTNKQKYISSQSFIEHNLMCYLNGEIQNGALSNFDISVKTAGSKSNPRGLREVSIIDDSHVPGDLYVAANNSSGMVIAVDKDTGKEVVYESVGPDDDSSFDIIVRLQPFATLQYTVLKIEM